MARFSGRIGFYVTAETSPGIWEGTVQEKSYRGDTVKEFYNQPQGTELNPGLTLGTKFSIVADKFFLENLGVMRYVTYMGVRWSITKFEIQHPRIILTVGGEYNGSTPT